MIISVSKGYRNNFVVANSYRNSTIFKNLTLGVPFPLQLEREFVGRPKNGDLLGETIISIQTHHLIKYLEARRKDCLQIRSKLLNTEIRKLCPFNNTKCQTMIDFKSFMIIQRLLLGTTWIFRVFWKIQNSKRN